MPIKAKSTKMVSMTPKKAKGSKEQMMKASTVKSKSAYGAASSKPPKMGPKTKKTLGTALMAAPVAVVGAMKMISDRQKKKDPLKWRDSGFGSYNKKK